MNKDWQFVENAIANGVLPADASKLLNVQTPSWALTIATFIGSWFAIIPLLLFLGFVSYEVFGKPPGSIIIAVICLVGGVAGLRNRAPIFVQHLCFCTVIVGIALAVYSAAYLNMGQLLFIVWFTLQLGVALAVRTAWVQGILGFVLVIPFLLLSPQLMLNSELSNDQLFDQSLQTFPQIPNAIVLAIAWALWCAFEIKLSGKRLVPSIAAIFDGLGVAILLAQLIASRAFFLTGMAGSVTHQGSADVANFGEGPMFVFNWVVGVQCLLTIICCVWLIAWASRTSASQQSARRNAALIIIAALVLMFFSFFTRDGGVVVVILTAALVTSRYRLFALGVAVLLGQLSGFYYALSWTLTSKALILALIGTGLGVAVFVARALTNNDSTSVQPADQQNSILNYQGNNAVSSSTTVDKRQIQLAGLIALGAAIAFAGVNYDVFKKEQVISGGQKIYISLAPRDPRSIMQGDYMALNFGFDRVIQPNANSERDRNFSEVKVLASLDTRGVATVKSLASNSSHLALGPNEILLPLKFKGSQWVLVTDAFYFPEGEGEPFKVARFGEFRALPDGRALLVGLTDENFMPIVAAKVRSNLPKP